jgi:hypothetical protein
MSDCDLQELPPGLLSFTPAGAGVDPLTTAAAKIPSLGVDMAAIRERVLNRRAEQQEGPTCTPAEHREVYNELKSRHQVNLDEEQNAVELEDPTLILHMEGARARLQQQEEALRRLPERETLRTAYLQTMRKLSDVIRSLSDSIAFERNNVELCHRRARTLTTLLSGRKAPGEETSALELAVKESNSSALSYEACVKLIEAAKEEVFLVRRDIETVGDGLLKLVDAGVDERCQLREYLALATRRNTSAP